MTNLCMLIHDNNETIYPGGNNETIYPGGKGGVAPFILTFISTFGTLGVKVALLKLMAMATLGEQTIMRWAMAVLPGDAHAKTLPEAQRTQKLTP